MAHTNIALAENVIQSLVEAGVREICLCAGARNSPFVVVLEKAEGLKAFSFFEERSASFFALGRAVESQTPVAVITTSGTAVAELLPAAIEATYTGVPLVLVTADRPSHYRGRGAPQAIEQVGLFSKYVEKVFDLEVTSPVPKLSEWSQIKPIHINVCFDEPLIDAPVEARQFNSQVRVKAQSSLQSEPQGLDFHRSVRQVKDFIKAHDRPLVLVGPLKKHERASVAKALRQLSAPVYLEASSGLRGTKELEEICLKSGDKFICKAFEQQQVNSVVRLGGVPTLRFWRDLEAKFKQIPVLSVSNTIYSGLARASVHVSSLAVLDHLALSEAPKLSVLDSLAKGQAISTIDFKVDQKTFRQLETLLERFPQSELSMIHKLASLVEDDPIYLGNSLPIREWDAICWNSNQDIFANRGANGIDGQLSTFLGWSGNRKSWGVFGDLTTLYDLSCLWIDKQMSGGPRALVIINNGGGQIFGQIFKKEIFLNSHNIEFSHWAKMWGWDYQNWKSVPDKFSLESNIVIEISPDPKQSRQLQEEIDKL